MPRSPRPTFPALLALAVLALPACRGTSAPTGALFGQGDPPAQPAIFAPGLVSTGARTRDIALSPDGRELFFVQMEGGFAFSVILTSHMEGERWTRPEVASFSGDPRWHDLEPHLAPDGGRLFFVSDRPDTASGATDGNEDIWMCTRGPAGWSVPTRLGPPVDTTAPEFFPSVTRGGVLYFTRRDEQTGHEAIWRAQPLPDGSFAQPTQLDSTVNSGRTQFNAFVAPDESYVIVCVMGRADNLGQIDYFISFHDSDGSWHGPVNLGDQINGTGKEGWSPYVSPDGRAFFFMSSRRAPEPAALAPLTRAKLNALHDSPGNGNGQIWWMDAGFLSRLREKAG